MNAVFADTYYYLALLNPADAGHSAAISAALHHVEQIVTTDWILVEVGDALSSPQSRPRFLSLVTALFDDPTALVVPATRDLLLLGIDLFRRRDDKSWTLTDCLSFVVMESCGIAQALTADEHFRQAGFQTLL